MLYNLHDSYGPEALKHQSWLRNRLRTRANGGNKSLIELLTKCNPDRICVVKSVQQVKVNVKSKTMNLWKKCDTGSSSVTKKWSRYIECISSTQSKFRFRNFYLQSMDTPIVARDETPHSVGVLHNS